MESPYYYFESFANKLALAIYVSGFPCWLAHWPGCWCVDLILSCWNGCSFLLSIFAVSSRVTLTRTCRARTRSQTCHIYQKYNLYHRKHRLPQSFIKSVSIKHICCYKLWLQTNLTAPNLTWAQTFNISTFTRFSFYLVCHFVTLTSAWFFEQVCPSCVSIAQRIHAGLGPLHPGAGELLSRLAGSHYRAAEEGAGISLSVFGALS